MKPQQNAADIAAATARIDDFVEHNRSALIELCAALISARSVNPPGRTIEAAAVIQEFLANRGVVCERLTHVTGKPNIVAQIGNSASGRHLIFNGHLDTIDPGEESEWSIPIFELLEQNGKLFDIDARLTEITQRVPGVSFRHIKGWNPNWTTSDTDIVGALETAVSRIRGTLPEHVVRLPASDASRWRWQGIPAICYGPQPLLASGVDDFAYAQDVVDCAKIYALAAIAYFTMA